MAAGDFGDAGDEIVEQASVDVNPLNPAAGLPAVEKRSVGEVFDGVVEIGVGPHIGRILAAQLQAEPGEGSAGGDFHRPPAGHRAGEVNLIDGPAGDQTGGAGVV